MALMEPEIAAYNQAMVAALRTTDPEVVRQFAAQWGERLGNRGLRQLAQASAAVVERRMWMMIFDRPDLADLHDRAGTWLSEHSGETNAP